MTDYKVLFEKTSPAKLVLTVGLPGILSMFLSSMYRLVDAAFVGHLLGSTAFAALNLVIPFVILNFALSDLVGVGSSVIIAIRLGEKDEKTASVIFSTATIMIAALGSFLGLLLFIFADDLIRLMGADSELTVLAAQYLRVYAAFSPLTTALFAVDNFLRLCGKVRYSLLVNVLVAVSSLILEIFFLVVFRWGIWAAALANCLGIFLSVIVAYTPFLRKKLQLKFTRPALTKRLIRQIMTNGAPTFLNNVAGRIVSIIMNIALLRLGGAMAVSAYGVLLYAEDILLPILYGLCDSLQPAIGYNYGARNYDRIHRIRRLYFGICAVLSFIMTAVMFFAREAVVGIYVAATEIELRTLAAGALSIFASAYLFRWVTLATQSFLSAIGQAGPATILSICFAFVFPLAALVLLSPLGLLGIWLNMPVACLASSLLAAFFLKRTEKSIAGTT